MHLEGSLTAAAPPARPPIWAISHCRELTRFHSQTFYLASNLFGPRQRQAIWAVYASCRIADDLIDTESALQGQDPRTELEDWWQGVGAALDGTLTQEQAEHPVYAALAWAARSFDLPRAAFEELYLGLGMDLAQTPYVTLDQLSVYCRRVAGVVGLMIAPICGYAGGEATLARAVRLGQAMQLTNILRDVGEDLRRGRLYLPAELLERFGVSQASLEAGQVTPQYVALMGHLSTVARGWYAEGRVGLPQLRGGGRLAVAVAARAYEGILDALEAQGFDNFQKRAHVSGPRKLLMVPQVWWALRSERA